MREPDLSSDGPAKLPDGGKLSERDRRLAHVVWGYDARDARPWRAWNEVAAPDGIRSTHWLLAASRFPAIEYKHGLARLDPESPLGRVYRRVPFGAG
jgi:hypothetical protein